MRAATLALALTAVPCLMAAPADSALTGVWRIAATAPAKGRPAELGELKVDAGGNFQWSENRQLAGLGALQPHRPATGPRAGQDCWLFHRGKGDYYAFRDGDTLEVYDAASNTLIGKGSKTGSRRR